MSSPIENLNNPPKKYRLRKIFFWIFLFIGLLNIFAFLIFLFPSRNWLSWQFALSLILLIAFLSWMKKFVCAGKHPFWLAIILFLLILGINATLQRQRLSAVSEVGSLGKTARPTIRVQGNSMSPAYTDGDYLLAQVFDNYQRGDVVVFERNKQISFKRIVAVPGDTIEIKNGKVLLNGSALDEPYAQGETKISGGIDGKNEIKDDTGKIRFTEITKSDEKKVILGENTYYVLGDNREQSADSRSFGPIYKEQISGKVVRKLF